MKVFSGIFLSITLSITTLFATCNDTSFSTIPCIDITQICNASGAKRTVLIQHFGDSLKEVGFIGCKIPKDLQTLVEKSSAISKHYFSLPYNVKMVDWHDNNGQTGYSPYSLETAAGQTAPDLKETYFIPPQFLTWPREFPEFKNVMSIYHKKLSYYAQVLLNLLAEYLEVDENAFEGCLDAPQNLLRLAHYFSPCQKSDPNAVWAATHEDLNALTLLPRPDQPGLELLTKSGEWIPVFVPEGYMIVNLGLQVQRLTAGLLPATPHRVHNPNLVTDRHASIFFASLLPDTSLAPFDLCIEEQTQGMSAKERKEFLQDYPDITVMENLLSRLIEMGAYPNPPPQLVKSLVQSGLLRSPPADLIEKYPELF